jgi:hypothetical protein
MRAQRVSAFRRRSSGRVTAGQWLMLLGADSRRIVLAGAPVVPEGKAAAHDSVFAPARHPEKRKIRTGKPQVGGI